MPPVESETEQKLTQENIETNATEKTMLYH